MSFNVNIDLGDVGFGITGHTVSISGCTNLNCTSCTSLLSNQPATPKTFTVTNVPDNVVTLFVKVDNGDCTTATQCIVISGIPTPTPTPTNTPGPTATPIPPTPTPTATNGGLTPTATPTPTATNGGGGGTTYTYYVLRPCDMIGQPGYLTGDYDVYSTGYSSPTFSSGDRVEGSVGYFYVIVGSTTTDPGGTKYSVSSTGLTGCPEGSGGGSPTATPVGVSFGIISGTTFNNSTNACNQYESSINGSIYLSGDNVPNMGDVFYTTQSCTPGQEFDGGQYWYFVYRMGTKYACRINTSGTIMDEVVTCGAVSTATPTPTPTTIYYYGITTLYSGSTGTDADNGSACYQINVNGQPSNVQDVYTTTGYLVDGEYAYLDALGPEGAGLFNGQMHYYSDGVSYGRIGYTGLITIIGQCAP